MIKQKMQMLFVWDGVACQKFVYFPEYGAISSHFGFHLTYPPPRWANTEDLGVFLWLADITWSVYQNQTGLTKGRIPEVTWVV